MIRFEQDGKVFVYDFDKLCAEQMIIAEQSFLIQGERINAGIKNGAELEQVTTETTLFKAFGILLLEMNGKNIVPFDIETHTGIEFFRKMNAKNLVKVYNGTFKNVNKKDEKGKTIKVNNKFVVEQIKDSEGIQKDFFIKLKRPSPESQRQLKNMSSLMNQQQSGLGLNLSEMMKNAGNLVSKIEGLKESSTKTKTKKE